MLTVSNVIHMRSLSGEYKTRLLCLHVLRLASEKVSALEADWILLLEKNCPTPELNIS